MATRIGGEGSFVFISGLEGKPQLISIQGTQYCMCMNSCLCIKNRDPMHSALL